MYFYTYFGLVQVMFIIRYVKIEALLINVHCTIIYYIIYNIK
jgi:hypothetical protein